MSDAQTALSSPLSRLLPPSTNYAYRGSLLAAYFLTLIGVLTVIPGCIHTFLRDGGAGSIAGLDLGACGGVIIALFAWAGATQIVFGIVMVLASLRYRPLVPGVLALVALERGLHAINAWSRPGAADGHRPPEHYAVLVVVPLVLIALTLALGDRRHARARS